MPGPDYKRQAAERALAYVEPGMRLGLGTGSTAAKFVDLLGAKVKSGFDILCVATSEATAAQAKRLGIPLTTLDDCSELDLTVDGADEIDDNVDLIKGGGGALLREKIVACASDRLIIIADASKRVDTLGKFPLPLEVVRFGFTSTAELIEEMAAAADCEGAIKQRLARDGKPFVTDGGNYILDCSFGAIDNSHMLDLMLRQVPGLVEHGMFLGMVERAIIAGPGGVEELEPTPVDDMLQDIADLDISDLGMTEVDVSDLDDDEPSKKLLRDLLRKRRK